MLESIELYEYAGCLMATVRCDDDAVTRIDVITLADDDAELCTDDDGEVTA